MMRRITTAVSRLLAVAGLLGLVASCMQPLSSASESASPSTSLELRIGGLAAQTVVPDRDMSPVRYEFIGRGPDGAQFELSSSDGSERVSGIVRGSWTVEARGYNASEYLVVSGEAVVDVEADTQNAVSIPVTPVDGSGALEVTAEWNPDHVVAPAVEASLTDAGGEVTSLAVPVTEPGRAAAVFTSTPAGYHQLSVQLTDSGEVISGAGETVRIVAEATTSVTLSFPDVNKVGQPVVITADSFVLAWDAPADGSSVDEYRVYARPRGAYEWSQLTAVSALEATITSSLLSHGTYELAVTAVVDGAESDKHTSMDDDAQPATGWYVDFRGP